MKAILIDPWLREVRGIEVDPGWSAQFTLVESECYLRAKTVLLHKPDHSKRPSGFAVIGFPGTFYGKVYLLGQGDDKCLKSTTLTVREAEGIVKFLS